jgi:hypothetical protein
MSLYFFSRLQVNFNVLCIYAGYPDHNHTVTPSLRFDIPFVAPFDVGSTYALPFSVPDLLGSGRSCRSFDEDG